VIDDDVRFFVTAVACTFNKHHLLFEVKYRVIKQCCDTCVALKKIQNYELLLDDLLSAGIAWRLRREGFFKHLR
jgi:hypothetical protein